MNITKIVIKNFRTFKEETVTLNKFNLIIGANASGKSNFIQLFKFLRDIINHGTDNAIAAQGGIEYINNINIGKKEPFSVKLYFDDVIKINTRITYKTYNGQRLMLSVYETVYELSFSARGNSCDYHTLKEVVTLSCHYRGFTKKARQKNNTEYTDIGKGTITISNIARKLDIQINNPPGINLNVDDIIDLWILKDVIRPFFKNYGLHTLLEMPKYSELFSFIDSFHSLAIYDFDPRLLKKSQPLIGKAELEEDGSNLAIVLNKLLRKRKNCILLHNLISDILPFADNFGIDTLGNTINFKLKEVYQKKKYIPAFLLSDGTLNVAAIIIALYFERNKLTIIEEPERNIHPYLISKIAEMMKDSSNKTQIITTTHNPEFIRNINPENILFISRDNEGYSQVSRPIEKKEIQVFLKNEIGIDDLYTQNLLNIF